MEKERHITLDEGHELAEKGGHLLRKMIWIAIVLLPLFPDYLFMSQNWTMIFVIRLGIVLYFLLLLYIQRIYQVNYRVVAYFSILPLCVFLSYITATTPNEYRAIYHLNFMAVFIVMGLFLLWHWKHSILIVFIFFLEHLYFLYIESLLNITEFVSNGTLLLFTIAFASIAIVQLRYNSFRTEFLLKFDLANSNHNLRDANTALEEKQVEIIAQKANIEKKNHNITASINYAGRIQSAILGDPKTIEQSLGDAFILFKPKDIVSGDFYWFAEQGDYKIVIAADCTGHGVPGAFMTVLGHSLLNDIILDKQIYEPKDILTALDQRVIHSLQQRDSSLNKQVNDGMDMSILMFRNDKIYFAGAKNPLYHVHKGEMQQVKGARFPIGSSQYKKPKEFVQHTINVATGDMLYLFSDGFQDQFGGEQNQKYMTKHFRNLLLTHSNLTTEEQKGQLTTAFTHWKAHHPQTDDCLVIGIRI